MSEEEKVELPMMPLLRSYIEVITAENPFVKKDGVLMAAAMLTASDTVLRYADYMIKAANAPKPEGEPS